MEILHFPVFLFIFHAFLVKNTIEKLEIAKLERCTNSGDINLEGYFGKIEFGSLFFREPQQPLLLFLSLFGLSFFIGLQFEFFMLLIGSISANL
jgi:hypothetical protein